MRGLEVAFTGCGVKRCDLYSGAGYTRYLCANRWKGFIGQLASRNTDRGSKAWITPPNGDGQISASISYPISHAQRELDQL
jgi:hypothetical protein